MLSLIGAVFTGVITTIFLGNFSNLTIDNFSLEGIEIDIYQVLATAVIVPIVETIIGQLSFILVASVFTKSLFEQWLLATIAFAALHSFAGGFISFIVQFFGAGVLAFAFVIKRKRSLWSAFWVTTVLHGIWNLQAIGLIALLGPS